MKKPTRILIVEDLATDAELAKREVRKVLKDCTFQVVETRQDFLKALKTFQPDLILSDYALPHFDGITALNLALQHTPLTPLIIWTGSSSEDIAVDCMKAGANNYVIKENLKRLGPAVTHALKERGLLMARKEAEEDLKERERQLTILFSNLPGPVYRCRNDANYTMEFISDSIAELSGYPAEDFRQHRRDFSKLIHPADREQVWTKIQTAVECNQPFELTYRIITAIGDEKWVWEKGQGIRDAEGQLQALEGFITDITEIKRSQEVIQLNEQRFRALIQNGMASIALLAADGTLLWESPAAVGTLNYAPNEHLGRNIFRELMHPDDLPWTQALFARIAREPGSRHQGTFRLLHGDGTWHWVEAIVTNMLNQPGINGIVANYRDVNEQKQAEVEVHKSQTKYQNLVETSHDLIWSVDVEGKFTFVNRAAREIYGYEPEELIGRSFFEILDPDHYPLDSIEFKETIAGVDELRDVETYVRHRGGRQRILSANLIVMREAGEVIGVTGSSRDITERKQAEKALRDSEQRYRALFEDMPVAIWEEDFSQVKQYLDALKEQGVTDFSAYFAAHPDALLECAQTIRILNVNQAAVRMYEAESKQQLIESTDHDLSAGEREHIHEVLADLAEGKTSNSWEGTDETLTGKPIEVSVNWSVAPDNQGDYFRLIVTTVDITERKQVQEHIGDLLAFNDKILNHSPTGIITYKFTGECVFANENAAAIVGANVEQLRTQNFKKIEAWKKSGLYDLVEKAITTQAPVIADIHHVSTFGKDVWMVVRCVTFKSKGEDHVLLSISDITERKLADIELQQTNDDLGLLHAINEAVVHGQNLDSVIELLAKELNRIFSTQGNAIYSTIYMLTPDKQFVRMQKYFFPSEIARKVEKLIGFNIPIIESPIREGGHFHRALTSGRSAITSEPKAIQEWMADFAETKFLPPLARAVARKLIPQIYKLLNIKSVIAVPLVSEEETIGFLDVSSSGMFTPNDVKRIENIGSQLTAIIQRQQANEKIRRSEEFLQNTQNALSANVAILDETGTIIQVNSAWRKFGEQNGLMHPDSGVGLNYLEVCDAATGSHAEEAPRVAQAIRAVIAGQRSEDRIEYSCHSPDVNRWFTLHITKFESGDHVWVVLAHEDISERKRAEIERQALLEVMLGLANTEDLQELLELIHHSIANVVYARNFFVVLYDESNGFFEEVYSRDQYDPPAPPSKLEKSITSYVFRSGEPLLLTQASFDELAAQGEVELVGTNSASWLGVPLKTSGQTIGVMAVQHYENDNCYSARDRDFLASIATQVALVIEHREAGIALQESEEHYRAIFEGVQDAIFVESLDGRILMVNERACEMFGYSREEFLTKTIADIVPDGYQILTAGDHDALLSVEPRESANRRANGEIFPIEVSGRLQMINGKAVLLVVVRDITERKKAAESLQESEERFSSAFEYASIGMALVSPEGHWLRVNWALCELVGYSKEELSQKTFQDITHPEDIEKDLDYVQQVLVGTIDSYEMEKRYLHKAGNVIWVLLSVSLVRDNEGKPLYFVAQIQDITERKQVEEKLRTSESRYRLATQATKDVIWEWTLEDNQLIWTENAQLVFGYSPEDIGPSGNWWDEHIHPNDRERVISELNTLIATVRGKSVWSGEYRFLLKDGSYAYIDDHAYLERDLTGRTVRMIGAMSNITERKRAEDAEREQRALAEALRDTAETLSSTLDYGEVLDHILTAARRVVPHDAATIMLIDGEIARVVRAQGYAERGFRNDVLKIELPLAETTNLQQMLATGQPVVVSDTRSNPAWKKARATDWMGSNVGAPISIYGEVVGFILLDSETPGFFTPVHAERLESFANQAAIAIHNARLLQQAQEEIAERKRAEEEMRRETEMRVALLETTRDLVIERDLSSLLHTIVERAARLLHAGAGGLYLCEPELDQVRCLVSYNTLQDFTGITLKYGEGAAGKVAQTGEPLIVGNYNTWEGSANVYDNKDYFRALLTAPIKWQDQVIGVIHILEYRDERHFTENDLNILISFANQAAIAIHNAGLLQQAQEEITERKRAEEEIRRRVEETSALLQTSLALTNLDLNVTLETISHSAKSLFAADGCRIFLMEANGESLRCVLALQENPVAFSNLRVKLGEGVTGAVAASGRSEIVNEMQKDPRAIQVPGTPEEEDEAIMFAPLKERDQTIGVLSIRRVGTNRPFRPDDLELLEALASMAASAVSNARLFEEAQRRLTELEALYENGLAVGRLLKPTAIGNRVINIIARYLPWHHVTIRLRREESDDLELVAFSLPNLKEEERTDTEQHFIARINKVGQGLSGWAIQTGTPLRTGNVQKHPQYIDTHIGIQSGLYMPLKVGERVIGVISVESEVPDAFTEQDERLLATLGSQAAIAFENARLYQAIEQELSERKRAEEALRTSESHYRELADSITDILFEMDQDLKYTHWNKASELFSGISAKDAIGKSMQEVWGASEEQAKREAIYRSVLKEQQVKTFEIEIGPKEQKRALEITAYPSTRGVSVVAKDVTERKRSEIIMQKRFELMEYSAQHTLSELMQRTVDEVSELTGSVIGFFHFVREDQNTLGMQTWSTNALRLFNVPLNEGTHLPLDQAGVWAEAVRQRCPLIQNDYESLSQKKGLPRGHVSVVREIVIPIIRNEKIVAVMGIGNKPYDYTPYDLEIAGRLADYAWDITERKQMEVALAEERNQLARRVEERTADLSRANSNLARALRVKDEFLANMSHELRTPLNAILGLSESLGEQIAGPLNEKQQKYITTISESGHHLLSLINDILDLAKIEAGQITLDINKVDIHSVCQASLRMIKQLAQKKNQEVTLFIEEGLGLTWADERRLKQMIVNLLGNAVKFTPENGKIGLEVHGDEEANKVTITVWDTGIGIKQEDLTRLFQPFVQVDSGLAREATGTGLGLALVAQMARLHGGSVNAVSEPGVGSRFSIVLPWEPALALDSATRLRITGKFRAIKLDEAKKPTILLVEDTKEVVMMLSDYLQLAGYKIVTAQDGVDALVQAKLVRPDLILMDIQMPRMDGLEATRRLRDEPEFRYTPIIALTALAMPNDRERCLAAGMDEYISKPINLKALVKIIQSCLSNKEELTPS